MQGGAWLCVVSCEVPYWSIAVAVAEDANAVTQSNADGDQFQITKKASGRQHCSVNPK